MGYSHRAAAQALGISLRSYQQIERGINWTTGRDVSIDHRTALACAAIAAGLKAWPDQSLPGAKTAKAEADGG